MACDRAQTADCRPFRETFRRAVLAALIVFLIPTHASSSELSPSHQEWLEQVDSIITDEERQAFSSLQRNYQREAFIARFWQERDPQPETGQNEFLEIWQRRSGLVAEQFGDSTATGLEPCC